MGQPFRAVPPQEKQRDLQLSSDLPAAGSPDAEDPAAAQAAALEAGRLLFAKPWQYRISCHSMRDLPPAEGVEVAFAGRSNVGKSTLLNALTGQKTLAKSSNTPGRTRQLNFFDAGSNLSIVDMPGYGYARAPKKDIAAWTRLVFDYLRGRPNLRRVYLLIDARHGLKPIDQEAMTALDEAAASYQAVLTKADKVKPAEREKRVAEIATAIVKRPAAHPQVLITSAADQGGIAALRAAISEFDESTAAPAGPAE